MSQNELLVHVRVSTSACVCQCECMCVWVRVHVSVSVVNVCESVSARVCEYKEHGSVSVKCMCA